MRGPSYSAFQLLRMLVLGNARQHDHNPIILSCQRIRSRLKRSRGYELSVDGQLETAMLHDATAQLSDNIRF